jgi:GAF domain-containing protein
MSTDHLTGLADPHRIKVLSSLDLDNPELRGRLDALTQRTATRLELPISLISMVLDTAQFLAGSYGVDGWIAAAQGTPVEWSFCAHAVAAHEPYIVPDAAAEPRLEGNPLVVADGFLAYAGVPIAIDGAVLGTHCVIGHAAREFTDADLEELHRTAEEIVDLLQHYRLPQAESENETAD